MSSGMDLRKATFRSGEFRSTMSCSTATFMRVERPLFIGCKTSHRNAIMDRRTAIVMSERSPLNSGQMVEVHERTVIGYCGRVTEFPSDMSRGKVEIPAASAADDKDKDVLG